jgi:hypothetical protein
VERVTKTFAFKVSLQDMIRKLRYRYEQPIDYLNNFVELLHAPGSPVDITITDKRIELHSPRVLDDVVMNNIREQKLLTITSLIPPSAEYHSIDLRTGDLQVTIDAERHVATAHTNASGTHLVIERDGNEQVVNSDVSRLRRWHTNSDLATSINGESLQNEVGTMFEAGNIRGKIAYNPRSKGGLHFFKRGIYIASKPFASGIDVQLYNHDLETTVTRSRVITKGRGKAAFEKLEEAMPKILLGYLRSDEVTQLRATSEESYQTILRTVFERYHENPEIVAYARANIRFARADGSINTSKTLSSTGGLSLAEQKLHAQLTGQQIKKKKILPYVATAAIALLSATSLDRVPVKNAQHSSPIDKTSITGQRHSGADFLTQNELASIINGSSGGSVGYVRYDTSNFLYSENGQPIWADHAPFNELEVQGLDMPIPTELKQFEKSDRAARLNAIRKYIKTHFTYDSVSPSDAHGEDVLTASARMKKLVCSGANSYAAILNYKMGERDLRASVGTLDGGPHLWLEVKHDGQWMVYDSTPPKIDEGLDKLLHTGNTVYASGPQGAPLPVFPDSDPLSLPTRRTNMPSVKTTVLSVGAALLLAYMAKALIKGQSSTHDSLQELGDILGVKTVETGDGYAFESSSKTLCVPAQDLKESIARTALQAVPYLTLKKDQELRLYRRIVDSLRI